LRVPSSVFLRLRPPRISTLFPYTTLFRSPPPSNRDACHGSGIFRRGLVKDYLTWGAPSNKLLSKPTGATSHEHRNRRSPHGWLLDRKSTRLNSSHVKISYAVFCLKKKKKI